MTVQEARDAFEDWSREFISAFDDGVIPMHDDRERARVALLVRALKIDQGGDRRSVWLAFSAGWASCRRHLEADEDDEP